MALHDDQDQEDHHEYSFRNAPPNLKPAFKHFAHETLTNSHAQLTSAIERVDIECAIYHIQLLQRYLELKYPITRRLRTELCHQCLKLLFEFPTNLVQNIALSANHKMTRIFKESMSNRLNLQSVSPNEWNETK